MSPREFDAVRRTGLCPNFRSVDSPWKNIAAAHEAVENHIVGKVVIDLTASEDSIEN
jgi:hypothetical protein